MEDGPGAVIGVVHSHHGFVHSGPILSRVCLYNKPPFCGTATQIRKMVIITILSRGRIVIILLHSLPPDKNAPLAQRLAQGVERAGPLTPCTIMENGRKTLQRAAPGPTPGRKEVMMISAISVTGKVLSAPEWFDLMADRIGVKDASNVVTLANGGAAWDAEDGFSATEMFAAYVRWSGGLANSYTVKKAIEMFWGVYLQ